MARTVTPLSDSKCEAAKPREKDYTLFDGQGLFLLVKANGGKVWRFKYTRPDGRAGLATFGNYPALSLKAARGRRADALELLAHGKDPIVHAKQSKVDAAMGCRREGRLGHRAQHERTLEAGENGWGSPHLYHLSLPDAAW